MTQQELDALPEVGGISQREEIIDGRKVVIPVIEGGAMFQGLDDGVVVGNDGQRWMIGQVSGVRSKRRIY